MPELISYADWIKDTSKTLSVRSPELKQLDEALKTFERTKSDADFNRVRLSYDVWANKKGGGGTKPKTGRDGKGAVEKLETQLYPQKASVYKDDQAHSRKGLLYLFAKTEVEVGALGFAKILLEGASDLIDVGSDLPGSRITDQGADIAGHAKTVTIKALEAGETALEKRKAAKSVVGLPKPEPKMNVLGAHRVPVETESSFRTKIEMIFKGFVQKVWEEIKSRASAFWYASNWEKAVDVWSLSSKVAKVIVGQVASQAAPFLSGAIDIVNGVNTTVTNCYHRWKSYSLGKEVELNAGHPGVVADSIERAMNLSIGKGLYQTFKGAAAVTADAFSGGASAIGMLVVSGCEILAKLVYRIWETVGMRAFCSAAKERYEKGEVGYADASDFKKWFYEAAYALPCISALAINSGITGDKMLYISMFSDRAEANVISQKQFNSGVEYADRLKDWSRQYLADTGYKFRSSDALVQALHARSVSSKKEVLTQISRKEGVELP